MRLPLACLLYIVARAGIIAEIYNSGEAIQTVANSNIQGLAKDTVTLSRVCNYLGVAARDV